MLHTFKVTKEILQESVERLKDGNPTSFSCAIACAIQKQFPEARVGFRSCLINDKWYDVSEETRQYISKFDHSDNEDRINLPEFEFTLNI